MDLHLWWSSALQLQLLKQRKKKISFVCAAADMFHEMYTVSLINHSKFILFFIGHKKIGFLDNWGIGEEKL